MVEAVIFDIDGTIIDSIDLHIQAWRLTFQKFGKDVSVEAIRRQIGKGADECELFKQEYLPKVKALPKVRVLFERIKREGKQIALASTAKQDELHVHKKI